MPLCVFRSYRTNCIRGDCLVVDLVFCTVTRIAVGAEERLERMRSLRKSVVFPCRIRDYRKPVRVLSTYTARNLGIRFQSASRLCRLSGWLRPGVDLCPCVEREETLRAGESGLVRGWRSEGAWAGRVLMILPAVAILSSSRRGKRRWW